MEKNCDTLELNLEPAVIQNILPSQRTLTVGNIVVLLSSAALVPDRFLCKFLAGAFYSGYPVGLMLIVSVSIVAGSGPSSVSGSVLFPRCRSNCRACQNDNGNEPEDHSKQSQGLNCSVCVPHAFSRLETAFRGYVHIYVEERVVLIMYTTKGWLEGSPPPRRAHRSAEKTADLQQNCSSSGSSLQRRAQVTWLHRNFLRSVSMIVGSPKRPERRMGGGAGGRAGGNDNHVPPFDLQW